MFVGKRIAKVMSQMQPGLQKCHYLPNYRCEVDRKELRGSVSQIVSVSVIVSGARLEFKRGVIGVQATSPQQPARGSGAVCNSCPGPPQDPPTRRCSANSDHCLIIISITITTILTSWPPPGTTLQKYLANINQGRNGKEDKFAD